MSPLNIVTLASAVPQPWRNGGGTTQELLAWPQREDWVLRVSVARIDRSGPFSAFPGVMRAFCVLQGKGVRLNWKHACQTLRPGDPPLAFDGGEPPGCELLDGPTSDLNLMVQASSGQGALRPACLGQAWCSPAPWRGIYTMQPLSLNRDTAMDQPLPAQSLSWCTQAGLENWVVQSTTNAQAWWIEFQPTAASAQEHSQARAHRPSGGH